MRGNPGKRPLNKREPQVEIKAPICPAHLDEIARKEWDRMVPLLLEMRILSEADYMALSTLCQAYSTMAKAQEQLNATGILFKTPSGYVQQSPLISIVNQNAELVTKLCREFGVTPSARSRVNAEPPESRADDPWAALRSR
jgi:P27 family predicted phage terminase small subunit